MGDGEVVMTNASTGKEQSRYSLHNDAVVALVCHGSEIYSASQDGMIHRYSTNTARKTGSITLHGKATAVCVWGDKLVGASDTTKAANVVILEEGSEEWVKNLSQEEEAQAPAPPPPPVPPAAARQEPQRREPRVALAVEKDPEPWNLRKRSTSPTRGALEVPLPDRRGGKLSDDSEANINKLAAWP